MSSAWNRSKTQKDAVKEKKREMRKQERAKLKASQQSGEWTTIPIKSSEIQAKINVVDDDGPIVKIPRFVWADE